VRTAFRRFLVDLALNAAIPLVLYHVSKRIFAASEFTALAIATTFPGGKGLFDVVKRREVNPVSIVVLLGIGVSAVAVAVGGSPRILLLRESLFTGLFGLACIGSLILPRPLMFWFGYHFLVRGDSRRRRRYEASWALAEVRHASGLITLVWGLVFLGEFGIRTALIFVLSPGWVLTISPIILGALTLTAVVWTFRYARKAREDALPKIDALLSESSG